MAKIKLTKNELKKQKDALESFTRYLPTLTLKKQQLQLEILKLYNVREELTTAMSVFRNEVVTWGAVFAEPVALEKLIAVEQIHTETGNIAGTDIPVFKRVEFREEAYDFARTPLWVDRGIVAVKKYIEFKVREQILNRQLVLIQDELRITTQRVNLFEKVKIPEARENIRVIGIFLGDLQTAAVVTGKIAKQKIAVREGNAG